MIVSIQKLICPIQRCPYCVDSEVKQLKHGLLRRSLDMMYIVMRKLDENQTDKNISWSKWGILGNIIFRVERVA